MARLIDTSILIAMERQRLPFSTISDAYPTDRFMISSITATEPLIGVERADTDDRRTLRAVAVERILADVTVVPFDVFVARVHATLWSRLTAGGAMIGERDLIIAATALAHGHDVFTHNVRDFGRVPGLVVRRPNW